MHVWHKDQKSLCRASELTRLTPGASTSGLEMPSWVTPRLDHGARTSSAVDQVPRSSVEPAVITKGSLPGAYETASPAVPALPAAATTTMPLSQALSTAASSGSVRYDSATVEESERLITR